MSPVKWERGGGLTQEEERTGKEAHYGLESQKISEPKEVLDESPKSPWGTTQNTEGKKLSLLKREASLWLKRRF